ncbi:RNA-directed DNA polymerase, eukaryota, reverse transcriptase zinc-binding domain protein [Tanacetum coccineum]
MIDKRSPKTGWNVQNNIIDSIRKSANKYDVLEEENVNERLFENGIKVEREIIDVYEETSCSTKKMAQNDIGSSYMEVLNGIGLRKVCKQNVVKDLIADENISICAVLETRLKGNNVKKIGDRLFGRWNWYDNALECSRGCRILVGWDNEKIQCMIVYASDQAVLCIFEIQRSKKRLFCTFIHVENSGRLRKKLWSALCNYKSIINDKPWVIMGDLNVSLNLEDHSEGISCMTQDMEEFKECIDYIKIDNMCSRNEEFLEDYLRSHAVFLPYEISDHSLANLDEVQIKIDADPTIIHLREQGVSLFKEYNVALEDEENCSCRRLKLNVLECYCDDVCKAVNEFFSKGKLLWELNATLITLVPKVSTPNEVSNSRPITCCNVVYKCISKIITNRVKNALDIIINKNQSAFIPERQITDNILLTQELQKGYDCVKGPKRCSVKIDIKKAYDTVNWKFLEKVLGMFGFHSKMVYCIMTCVATPSYIIGLNGYRHGFFKGGRGLRQGDPLFSYLFTLVMEVFNLILQQEIC